MSSTKAPSARKPYQPAMPRHWWLRHSYFRRYMLREATVLPLLFFVGCLIGGLFSLTEGESGWLNWQAFMSRPWVMGLNLLALAASLYHAKTFFVLFPRVMPLRIGRRVLSPSLIVAAQWGGTAAVLVSLLWIVWVTQ